MTKIGSSPVVVDPGVQATDATAVKNLVNRALAPDAAGLCRIDKTELAGILKGYQELKVKNGLVGLLERAGVRLHILSHYPALNAAISAHNSGKNVDEAFQTMVESLQAEQDSAARPRPLFDITDDPHGAYLLSVVKKIER